MLAVFSFGVRGVFVNAGSILSCPHASFWALFSLVYLIRLVTVPSAVKNGTNRLQRGYVVFIINNDLKKRDTFTYDEILIIADTLLSVELLS